MSVRSAVGFPYTPNFPIGNQTLEETLANGNSASQQDITGVNNLDVFTINGGPIGGNDGLNSVLQVSNVAGGLDIQNVGTLTANKVVELGRESGFGYIANQVKTVTDATPFQIDISGGTLTLIQGSYLFNFKVNFTSATAVGNYTLQLFLDAVKITESIITPSGGVSGATLIINSIPVTITGATGVVSLKGLVSTPTFANVTIEGFGSSYYSYLEIYKGVSPPPVGGLPFTVTSGNAPFEIQQISSGVYLYYMKLTEASVLTPRYQFTLNEIFVVGGGQIGGPQDPNTGFSPPNGGNGGGVLLYNTPVSVSPSNAFSIYVGGGNGGITTTSVSNIGINLSSTNGTVALGGPANQQGGNGTLYSTTGLYYGGGGGGGGSGTNTAQYGQQGGLGAGGGSGSYTEIGGISAGSGGGNGINAGGGEQVSSPYGGGGGNGNGGGNTGGNGGDRGGAGGGGRYSVGGGGGGGGNYGGGGGGTAQNASSGVSGEGGGGGAGIVIIKVTL
jgi:hypothetical protein